MPYHPRRWPIWEVFFPPVCENCGGYLSASDALFCAQCWANAPGSDPRDLPKMKHVDLASAVYHFAEGNMIRAATHALKYEGFTRVGREMARRMLLRMPRKYMDGNIEWAPVPQHWARRMDRSFNQSAFLAAALAGELRRAKPGKHLKRIRNTPTQTARTVRERAKNVHGAFAVRKGKEFPKAVLLIDDVITTGATINECARTLKGAGVEWVGAFAFALAGTSKRR